MSEISFSRTLDDLCCAECLDHASLMQALESSQNQGELWDRLAAAALSAVCEEMQTRCSETPQIYDPDLLHRNFITARRNLDEITRVAFRHIDFAERIAEQSRDTPWRPYSNHAKNVVEAVKRLTKAYRAIREFPWRPSVASTKPNNALKS